jgi:hypothetical protein
MRTGMRSLWWVAIAPCCSLTVERYELNFNADERLAFQIDSAQFDLCTAQGPRVSGGSSNQRYKDSIGCHTKKRIQEANYNGNRSRLHLRALNPSNALLSVTMTGCTMAGMGLMLSQKIRMEETHVPERSGVHIARGI